jgi:NADPH-dependent curcumin reductase CurA
MSTTKARQIVLAARPQGKSRLTDFRLEETAIPTPGPGQFLLQVQYLSLDPYMRGRMDDRESYQPPTPLGDAMPGESVATVVASHHAGYSAGDIVLAHTGWRTHAMSDRADLRKLDPAVAPVTTGLGVLGKSLTVRGFINYDFAADHYAAFLREVGAGIADGRIRYREDFVDGLEKAPEAFIGMLEGRNFGKLIVRVDGGSKP